MKFLSSIIVPLLCLSWTVQLVGADITGPGKDRRVAALIRRLGAKAYALRQQARQELKQIGYPAFDLLLQAQYDEDTEVSLAARQLISQFNVKWVQPQDPTVVTYALRDFEKLSTEFRVRRGEWLAELEDGLGTNALLRIVRYDPAEVVAKQVALAFMENFDSLDPLSRATLDAEFDKVLGDSGRQPSRWLTLFRSHLDRPHDPSFLPRWKQLVTAELEQADTVRSSALIASSLAEWYASRAKAAGALDEVRATLSQLVTLRQGNRFLTLRTAHWLIDQELLDLFSEFQARVDEADTKNPAFAYAVAEALRSQGDQEKARQAAEKAFQLTNQDEAYADPLWKTDERYRTAMRLERRGMIEWSLREYGRIVDESYVHWLVADRRERSAKLMAELLYDNGRHQEAAEVLEKLVEEATPAAFAEDELDDDTASIVSRMYYFRAEQARQAGDREKQIDWLRKAVKADPTDADVLIAMYRLPRADETWQTQTKQRIAKAVERFEEELQRLRSRGVIANRAEISMQLNQVAWLVGNTEGNFRKAIQQSRKSLELQPKSAGSLDTLARTYFAVGDLENALKYQRRAVKFMPHSRQIRDQLEEFERHAQQKGTP